MNCQNCKHWTKRTDEEDFGECTNEKLENKFFNAEYGTFKPCTYPDFGCVLFETE